MARQVPGSGGHVPERRAPGTWTCSGQSFRTTVTPEGVVIDYIVVLRYILL